MSLSSKVRAILKKSEGLKLKPYIDPVGIPTIGVGCTSYENGKKVTMSDPPISEKRAWELAAWHFKTYQNGVDKLVKSKINSNQRDALALFAYNFGLGGLQKATLLKVVNENPANKQIDLEFKKYVKMGRPLVFSENLLKRRIAESALYFSGDTSPAVKIIVPVLLFFLFGWGLVTLTKKRKKW